MKSPACRSPEVMKAEELAFVQGWADTRHALVRWRRQPIRTLAPWTLGALAVAAALLLVVWLIAEIAMADPTGVQFPGVSYPATASDFEPQRPSLPYRE